MAEELKLTNEETAALDRIETELKGSGARLTAATTKAALESGDLCEKYRAIREPLKILVKLLRKIPKIGPKAADAIEFLMGLADAVCPV